MTPLFSIIIPTYNRVADLTILLRELGVQPGVGEDAEVIVVDDGSTDGTSAALAQLKLPYDVRCIRRARGGPGAARNAGVAEAGGRYLAFLEDDVRPLDGWLMSARRHLGEGAWDVLEGRTTDARTRSSIRRFEPVPRLSFIPCNLFVRRDMFRTVGGYDVSFFDAASGLYFREDADLGFRLLDTGARVTVAPDVVVEHPHQFSDLASCLRHARRYAFDPLLYRKHPRRYRAMIEVKTVAGLTVRRPLHRAALVYGASGIAAVLGAAGGEWAASAAACGLLAAMSLFVRWKYQGGPGAWGGGIRAWFGFLLLPAVYLLAFGRGSVKFRSYGAWL
jgi:glycosyltransferase involved in cell wall biosynthesis